MKILLASDHAGLEFKNLLKNYLKNLQVEDLGPYSPDSVDYTDFAEKLCRQIQEQPANETPHTFGILICGSGQGMAMKANKYSHIRAALCWDLVSTKLSRAHNNANVLCLGARLLPYGLALEMVDIFLKTSFLGGRHEKRVLKIPQ